MKSLLLTSFILLSLIHPAKAQLCTGSLGDAVVNINFGTGTVLGPPLPGATTTYNHSFTSCPNDGQYSVVNSTSNCFSNSWHSLPQDHTPTDADGYFMLINASFQPGDFYLDTIRGLCPNTSYEFAAWIANVLRPGSCNSNGIRPNLTFRIEDLNGNVLTTYNTGDIISGNTGEWNQYGLFFQTPLGIPDVVIRLTNNAPGGCGNDLALDDITFRPCGPKVDASVIVTGTPELFACENEAKDFMLSATYSQGVYISPSFQWQESLDNGITWSDVPGANSNNYLRPASGLGVFLYRMLIADGGVNITLVTCRLSSNTVRIEVVQPNVVIPPTFTGCFGTDIALSASGGVSYSWVGPNNYDSKIQGAVITNANLSDAGWYKVTITDTHGCTDQDSTTLIVNPAPTTQVVATTSVCEGASTNIQASGGLRYLWTPASGLSSDTVSNPVVAPVDTTLYTVYSFNEYGCFDTANTLVYVWKKPLANAGPDKKMTSGYSVKLDGQIAGSDIAYYWTPTFNISNPLILTPLVNPANSAIYTLHAESTHGCGTATDDVFIKVYEKMLIPNVFSPNGDGINDRWVIEPLDFFASSVTEIFNRYGQRVYRSVGYNNAWDGTMNNQPLPVGTYYYVIDLKMPNEPLRSGSVTIIR
ncbi:MAG: gliding motility-associated C-terminal domain-containing protein [Chitinophagaceae bacterium]|nr:gliding motility-associated C-terminal domain-containing protein [Chitinophagaceae bacterium]